MINTCVKSRKRQMMNKEIIKTAELATQHHPGYMKFGIEMTVVKGTIYKEDLHQAIYDVLASLKTELQKEYILDLFKSVSTTEDKGILFRYNSEPQQDFAFYESLLVEDNHIQLEYAEFRNERFGIPNLNNVLLPLVCTLEAIKRLTDVFSSLRLSVVHSVQTNIDAAFDYRTSPFQINYVAAQTYYACNESERSSIVEKESSIYEVVRRFYQLFISSSNCPVPYLQLTADQFQQVYDGMWK